MGTENQPAPENIGPKNEWENKRTYTHKTMQDYQLLLQIEQQISE